MTTEFTIGDVVRLKSGGPVMTILDLGWNPLSAKCGWFAADGRYFQGVLPVTALVLQAT